MKKIEPRPVNYPLIVLSVVAILVSYFVFRIYFPHRVIEDAIELHELPPEVKNAKPQIKSPIEVNIPILLYHYVEYVKDQGDTIRKSLDIMPFVLDAQIKTLKEAGYSFLTMADVANIIDGKVNAPSKPVVLSFDDGYRDFYTDVFPILKKYQVKATIFVVPNFLNKPNNMDIWQLKEIAKSGLVEVGAHTMDHSFLKGMRSSAVKFEVDESKKFLEKLLDRKIISFAYPYGAFDNQAAQIVKDAGFRVAVSTVRGEEVSQWNRFFLYRIRPGALYGQSLLTSLQHIIKEGTNSASLNAVSSLPR